MKTVSFLLLTLFLSSCKFEEDPIVRFKLTIVDNSVDFNALYFNAYEVDGESVQRVARTGFDGVDFRKSGTFDNVFPYVYGHYGFDFNTISKIPTGFFEVEMHIDSSHVVTKRFGEIKSRSTRTDFELFIKEDSVITTY